MFIYVLLVQLTALLACVSASPIDSVDHRAVKRQSSTTTTPVGFTIPMPINHFDASDARVYNNRYWVNDTWYKPGGPIFFLDNGESGVDDDAISTFLTNDDASGIMLAKKYGGIVVLWEHRYFGGSLPFALNSNSANPLTQGEPVGAPASYKYLTVEQALEDVVYFAKNLGKGTYQPADLANLAPSQTPWIFIGGSYPGVRAAILRIRNPEIIFASWSSSAPVQAIYSGASYNSASARSLPANCSADVIAITNYFNQVLSGSKHSTEYKLLQDLSYATDMITNDDYGFDTPFDYSVAKSYSPVSMASIIADVFGENFQYFGPGLVTHPFCNFLESYNPSVPGLLQNDSITSILTNPGTAIPSSQGFLASNGNNLAQGVNAFFYAAVQNYLNVVNMQSDIESAAQDAAGVVLDRRSTHNLKRSRKISKTVSKSKGTIPDGTPNADGASWQYLVSTEFGWFQGYDSSENTPGNAITPKLWSVKEAQKYNVAETFDKATIKSLPKYPNTTVINKYGGWNMNPSQVMFTDGADDPWRAGSVFSLESELGAPNRPTTNVIPACGQAPTGNAVYGYVFPGAGHCTDLEFNPYLGGAAGIGLTQDGKTPQQVALSLFEGALDVWLPCFGKGS